MPEDRYFQSTSTFPRVAASELHGLVLKEDNVKSLLTPYHYMWVQNL